MLLPAGAAQDGQSNCTIRHYDTLTAACPPEQRKREAGFYVSLFEAATSMAGWCSVVV